MIKDWTKPESYIPASGRRDVGELKSAYNSNVGPISPLRKRENQQLWVELREKYTKRYGGPLFVAKAQIGPGSDPCKVEHLFSAPLFLRGERYYMFKSEEDRNAFLAQCEGARACEDPLF